MKLKIDCKYVKITQGDGYGYTEVEIDQEYLTTEQLDHYIDYLNDKYGKLFLSMVMDRFELIDRETVNNEYKPRYNDE